MSCTSPPLVVYDPPVCIRASLSVCVGTQVCDCGEERDSIKDGNMKGGHDGRQLTGGGGGSRDSEKSISAEYLIEFEPSELSLLPGSNGNNRLKGRKEGENTTTPVGRL